MTQIAQGAHVYLFPEPGQVYRVQADDVATVQVLYGAPSAVITLTAQSQTFGPYDSPAKLKVTANTAPAEYTLLRAHYVELTQAQIDGGAVGALASDDAGGVIEPDGDVPTLGGAVTLPAMQAAFDAGTAPQKASFQSSVSGGKDGYITARQAALGRAGCEPLAILGDSRTASAYASSPTSTFNTHDWSILAVGMAGGGSILHYGGVSGDTTAQCFARVNAVIASGAKGCTLLCGTNDGWTTKAGVDASLASRRQITDALIASGIYVYSISEMPNATKSAAWHDLAQYFNAAESNYWVGNKNGEFVDVWAALTDPATGLGLAKYFHDGLHQGLAGAFEVAKILWPRLAMRGAAKLQRLSSSVRDNYQINANSRQRARNPLMQGIGGNFPVGNGSGVLPDYYSSVGDAPAIFSREPRADGCGHDMVVDINAGAGQIVLLTSPLVSHAEFTAGSRWQLLYDFTIERAENLHLFSASLSTDRFSFRANSGIQSSGTIDVTSPISFTVASPEVTIDASVAPPAAYAQMIFDIQGVSGLAWNAKVRFGRLTLNKLA